MTKNNVFLCASITICAIAIGVISINSSNNSFTPAITVGTESANLVLDSSQTPASITNSYQNNVNGIVTTVNGNAVELGFVNAKTADGAFVQLAPRGKIFNFQNGAEEGRQITGINAIKVTTASGNVAIRTAPYRSSSGVVWDKAELLLVARKLIYHMPNTLN